MYLHVNISQTRSWYWLAECTKCQSHNMTEELREAASVPLKLGTRLTSAYEIQSLFYGVKLEHLLKVEIDTTMLT
jgi:hypothetical protein